MVPVELFGVPRLLAGRREIAAVGATLGEVAADLARTCPSLRGRVIDPGTGWLLDGYQFALDGVFTRDPARPVPEGAAVLLVSSSAGG